MSVAGGRAVRAAALVFFCGAVDRGAYSAQQADPAPPAALGARASDERDATLARWREALELDLPAGVVAEGVARVDSSHRALSPPDAARADDLSHDAEAVALVARAHAALGRPERAEAVLAAAAGAEPAAAIELARARFALDRDDLDRALALTLVQRGAEGLAARYPERAECWLLAGRALARRGEDTTGAEKLLARFVDLAPHDVEVPAAWHMIAQGAIRRGDLARANEARERAAHTSQWQAYFKTRRLQIREKPSEPLPRLGLAQLWLAAGEPARAQAVLRELLAIAPTFCRAIALEGNCVRALGDAAAARAAWQRAIECDPGLPEPRYDRALLALAEEKLGDARADLEWLVAQPAGAELRFRRAHLELARLLRRAGDEDGARKRYERYVALGGDEAL